MTTMIALVLPKQQLLMIQVNDPDAAAFNLVFHLGTAYTYLDSNFQVPTATQQFNLYGDRVTKTVNQLIRRWPKLIENKVDVEGLLMAFAKAYKVKRFQLNVNADFSDRNTIPFSKDCLAELTARLQAFGFSQVF